MANSNPTDWVMWANITAILAVIAYSYIKILQVRGWVKLSPRWAKIIRFTFVCLLLTPLAARYQFSRESILYFSSAIFMIGALIKLKSRMGL